MAKVNDDWYLILQDNVPKRVPSRICSSVFVDLGSPSIVTDLPRSTVNEDEYLWLTNLTRDETELFLSGQPKGSFVIRESESQIDDNHKYSLSIKSKSNATHDTMHYPILLRQKRNDFIVIILIFIGMFPVTLRHGDPIETSSIPCLNRITMTAVLSIIFDDRK